MWRNPGETIPQDVNTYRPIWGTGGSTDSPITSEEFREHVVANGWPSDADVNDDNNKETRSFPTLEDFDTYKDYRWTSAFALPRNVPMDLVESAAQHALVEKGIFNYLLSIGKDRADEGGELILVDGKPRSGDNAVLRKLAFVSGTCYSPEVPNPKKILSGPN